MLMSRSPLKKKPVALVVVMESGAALMENASLVTDNRQIQRRNAEQREHMALFQGLMSERAGRTSDSLLRLPTTHILLPLALPGSITTLKHEHLPNKVPSVSFSIVVLRRGGALWRDFLPRKAT
jgi:hypothetical protein